MGGGTAISAKTGRGAGRYRQSMTTSALALFAAAAVAMAAPATPPIDDRATVARLDTEFQAAVKRHDIPGMERILHPEYTLVLGDGRVIRMAEQLLPAREKRIVYEQQDERPGTQTVRVMGDTVVVTAKLWIKGTKDGVPFDRTLWFSDT